MWIGLALAGGAHAEALPSGQDVRFGQAVLDWWVPTVQSVAPTALERPLANLRYSSLFGPRYDSARRAARLHAGLDIPSPLGTPVAASSAGVVVRAGTAQGYGNLVEIDHGGGVHTRYGHLSSILVERGEHVEQGATVGLVGSTGHSTGNHLHFEVRLDGQPVDPLGALETLTLTHTVEAPRRVEMHWAGWQAPNDDRLPSAVIR